MSDSINDIRYTAALAKVRGTYPHISDIADDVPVVSQVTYWENASIANAYKPGKQLNIYTENTRNARGSENHGEPSERCLPKSHGLPAATTRAPMTKAELKKADVVSQDKIWREAVAAEETFARRWDTAWGFLTEFDAKGNPISKQQLPESYRQFSESITPQTNAGNYGSRVHTGLGKQIINLEFQLSKSNKRKKLGSEMICY